MKVEGDAESLAPQEATQRWFHEFVEDNQTSNFSGIGNGSDSVACAISREGVVFKAAVQLIAFVNRPDPRLAEPLFLELTCHCQVGEEQGLWGSRGYAREWY